jgi:hypothetical protein
MARNPRPENSPRQVRKLRVTLGENLLLFGAFSFFVAEKRKVYRYAALLLGDVFSTRATSDVCGLASAPAAGLV